jgi:hypothetical protein
MESTRIDMGFMNDKPSQAGPQQKMIKNLKHLKQLLINKNLPDKIFDEVYGKAKAYPEGSLDFFWKSVDGQVNSAVEKIRRESGEDIAIEPPISYIAQKEKKSNPTPTAKPFVPGKPKAEEKVPDAMDFFMQNKNNILDLIKNKKKRDDEDDEF